MWKVNRDLRDKENGPIVTSPSPGSFDSHSGLGFEVRKIKRGRDEKIQLILRRYTSYDCLGESQQPMQDTRDELKSL